MKSILSNIKQIDLDWLYWYFKLGIPKNKVTSLELTNKLNKYIQSPVFFLSTGRCGTKWFTDLLQKNKQNAVFHSPTPTLARQSKLVFKQYFETNFKIEQNIQNLIIEMLLASRENYFRYTYKTNKRYIETNNYITFFAPILNQLFPDAIFIELTRNPISFIKSAYNRGYYTGTAEDDRRPIDSKNIEQWKSYNRIEKIAWLWANTYNYIDVFSKEYNVKVNTFDFNKLTYDNINNLLNKLKIDISKKDILKQIPHKVNSQKEVIANVEKEILKNIDSIKIICKTQALRLDYKL